MRWVTQNLPLVNPYWLFPVTFFHMPRKVYQKDLTHDHPRDWSEADQPVGPWITLWTYFEDKPNICLCEVISNIPAPLSKMAKTGITMTQPSQHLWVQPIRSHRLTQLKFSQVILPRSVFICFWLLFPLWTLPLNTGAQEILPLKTYA